MGTLDVRKFERERDLAAVLQLVGHSRGGRDLGAIFHPGGLQWWLRRVGRAGFEVAVLSKDGATVGLVLRDEGDVLVQTDLEHANDRGDLLAWVEARARETDEPEIFVSVADGDDGLQSAARAWLRTKREVRVRAGLRPRR
jgi:hypothetical protein